MAANRNLMRGNEQSKVLLLALTFEFIESELVEGQEANSRAKSQLLIRIRSPSIRVILCSCFSVG
jgi:hypothetical protein